MDIFAEIRKGISYKPLLSSELKAFDFHDLEEAFDHSSFLLSINKDNKVAVSWWVSSKRTRSYPYARIYNTLDFVGKRVTVIPIFKDEGKDGDRDFLQWDTISLMSLLGVYVIIGFYIDADKNPHYPNKITNQRFDINYLKSQISDILTYQSDALHWNLAQVDKIGEIGNHAIEAYCRIFSQLGIEMHSIESAKRRITEISKGRRNFMDLSRMEAGLAQTRESRTTQPKEKTSGDKACLTIKNYLGGCYFFTADEAEVRDSCIYLIEAKHSETNSLPSIDDIKDGLVKMILFTNLENVKVAGQSYSPVAVLKLTTKNGFDEKKLKPSQRETLAKLKQEANFNGFTLQLL